MNIFPIFTAVLLLSIIRTQPSTAQQSQLDCSDKLDIFFALDSSASLTNEQFNQEKLLVGQLLQRLRDTNRDARAGFLTFTETVSNVQQLSMDIALVQFELNRVIFDSEGKSLSAPLNYVHNNIFNASNTNLRPDSRRIFFLLTDGRDEVSSESELANISRRLFVDSNVTTVTIGIGQLIDLGQLNAIATDPNKENVIIFSDFTEALGNVSKISNRTCTIPCVEVVSAENVSGTSVNITWIYYSFTTVNYYKICLKTDRQSTNCNVSVLNIGSTLNQLLVQNLMPNTLYYITVSAFTDLGVTPISVELQVATMDNPAILPTSSTPITLSIPTSTSTERSSFSTQMSTTAVPCNTVSINSSSTFLPTSIIFAMLFLISLVINLILIIAVILLIRKIRQLKSPSKPKPAPSHAYECIDINEMNGNISSPTQQQSPPHDYVLMSSVHKQDNTKPPFYANLK